MPPLPPSHPVQVRYCAIISALARPSDIRSLPLAALHLVMTLRMCSQLERAGRDPLAELAIRLRSVAAAKAAVELGDMVLRCWPEPFQAARPCELKMTPDEATLAAIARCAISADRAGFGRVLSGFVRIGRHDALVAAAVEAVAKLQDSARS